MNQKELKDRTKKFAVAIVMYYKNMPNNDIKFTIGKQLLRAGTSVGANYRAACRARSRAEFSAKPGICEEECDEVMYWLEIIADTEIDNSNERQKLWREAEELLKIFVSSINTLKV